MRSVHTRTRRAVATVAAAVLGLGGLAATAGNAQAQVAPSSSTFFGVADWDRDGHQDLIVRYDATGDLYLYPGTSTRGAFTVPRVKIGNGWNGWELFGVADYDRDGNQDIITRNLTTHEIWLYPGQSVRGYSQIPPVRIYRADQDYPQWKPIGVADWDNDGKPDLLWYDPVPTYDGSTWVWETWGQGIRAPHTESTSHGIARLPGVHTSFGVTDWDRDGKRDLLVRVNATGDLMFYPGPGTRKNLDKVGAPTKIGNGWNGFSSFGLTDWDRDGHQDILTRNDSTRELRLYPGYSVRGYSPFPPVSLGYGW